MKIAQKLLLIILATSLLPLSAAGLTLLRTTQDALQRQIQSSLDNTAQYQLDRLSTINEAIDVRINNLLNKAQLRLLLDSYNGTPTKQLQTDLDQSLKDILESEDTFHRLYVVSTAGQVIASTDPALVGTDLSKTEVFSTAKQATSTSIFFSNQDDELEQYLAGPLKFSNELLGVAIVEATAAPYLTVTKNYAELGKTGESYLTRKTSDGTEQYITPLRFDTSAALKKVNGSSAQNVDYRGHPVLTVWRDVPDTDWRLVVKTDKTEVLTPIAGLRNTIIFILVLSVVATSFVALIVARRFTAPIMVLTSKTRRIIQGDFSQKIPINSSDEIGTLATAFNTMTSQLAESYSALEQKVAGRTQELNLKLNEIANAKAKDDAILSSIGDGLIVTDNVGYILLTNDNAISLLGLSKEGIVGKKAVEAFELHDESDQVIPVEKRPLYLTLQTGAKSMSGVKYAGTDGVKFLSVTATPVMQDGKLIGAVETVRDVTKEREVDRMKTEFISLASHQLRTPLSAIKWFSEMLMNGDAGDLSAEQKEFQKNISDSTERMIQLVSSLLNISRIESGRIIIDPKPTDLNELVSGIVNDLKGKTEAKKQNLTISVHPELPKINIDPHLIGQVYLNLLTNAIKYSPEGSDISVFVSRKGEDIVSQVTDNGYGIPKAEQGKMFQKFFRAANAVKVETDGTGLGMYLVKAIIESSGGKIWFESEEGKGSTFWFTIPVAGMTAKAGEVTIDS
jgi:PAS domain S-box-containing protein